MAKEAEKHGKFTNFTLGNESVREALGSSREPRSRLPVRRFLGQDSRLAAQRLSTALQQASADFANHGRVITDADIDTVDQT
jgi:hypothetical protein